MSDEALTLAIKVAGGAKNLATALGISPPAVYQWDRVPAERVGKVSALTGIPPQVLRPDLFPKAVAS